MQTQALGFSIFCIFHNSTTLCCCCCFSSSVGKQAQSRFVLDEVLISSWSHRLAPDALEIDYYFLLYALQALCELCQGVQFSHGTEIHPWKTLIWALTQPLDFLVPHVGIMLIWAHTCTLQVEQTFLENGYQSGLSYNICILVTLGYLSFGLLFE